MSSSSSSLLFLAGQVCLTPGVHLQGDRSTQLTELSLEERTSTEITLGTSGMPPVVPLADPQTNGCMHSSYATR
eukprot:1307143-Amphidinium_carterae.1